MSEQDLHGVHWDPEDLDDTNCSLLWTEKKLYELLRSAAPPAAQEPEGTHGLSLEDEVRGYYDDLIHQRGVRVTLDIAVDDLIKSRKELAASCAMRAPQPAPECPLTTSNDCDYPRCLDNPKDNPACKAQPTPAGELLNFYEDTVRALLEVRIAQERQNKVDPERLAQMIAHRACCGSEHDPQNGKLDGCCVVCGTPWPCDYAGPKPTASAPSSTSRSGEGVDTTEIRKLTDEMRNLAGSSTSYWAKEMRYFADQFSHLLPLVGVER
jgi:hypothetical protein